MASVIVFGPTGHIGSVAARTAAEHGAKVWLAMRDPSKAIPGLGKDVEVAGNFSRVKADLQDPAAVIDAIKTSGAKRAFVYLAHGAPNHMKATFEAMKSAGVEFVVVLSSFTIPTNKALRDIPASEMIPYVHAQAEANLDDVFGAEQYVALRPGAFATNLLSHKDGIAAGQVSLYGVDFEQDNITPGDIGRVAGTILVSGPRNGQKKVYLYGPQLLSLRDSVVKIGSMLNKDVEVTVPSREETYKKHINSGMPAHVAEYFVQVQSDKGTDKGNGERFPHYNEGVDNVQLYTGRPSTSFDEWVKTEW